MENKNNLFAKSAQINIIGLVGCALAVIGMLLPVISVNVYITSITIGHFQLTALVLIPMLLILGAAALYVMKMDKLAMISAAAAFVTYLLIVLLKRSSSGTISFMGQEISLDELLSQLGSGLKMGIGFYISILGYLAAIAGAFVNGKVFKAKAAPHVDQQPQMNPYMNPYMNQQPQGNPYMNQQPQANPYMNQQPQANPYVNQQPQGNPYMDQQPQGNPYMDQQPQQPKSSFSQQMQQAGQAVRQGFKKSDINPYVQQAQDKAQQAGQFVQDNLSDEDRQ